MVLSELKSGMENRKIDVEASFLSNNVEFSIEACDCHGRYSLGLKQVDTL